MVCDSHEDGLGQRLIAYIKPGEFVPTGEELAQYLGYYLPAPMIPAEPFDARLVAARTLSPSVRELIFERDDGKPFAFDPGQWVNLVLPLPGGEVKRAYSIASPPVDGDGARRFELAVTRVSGGAGSQFLHDLAVGDTLRAIGPHGLFTRSPDAPAPSIFVGTGTGAGITSLGLTLLYGLFAAQMVMGLSRSLVRHLSVGAFVDLVRHDQILSGPDGEQRFVGQEVPRRRLRWAVPGAFSVRDELVPWWSASHSPEAERLLHDVLWASPVTCLLRPRQAPPGWNPLTAAAFLHERAFARVVCHGWAASRNWIELGGAEDHHRPTIDHAHDDVVDTLDFDRLVGDGSLKRRGLLRQQVGVQVRIDVEAVGGVIVLAGRRYQPAGDVL